MIFKSLKQVLQAVGLGIGIMIFRGKYLDFKKKDFMILFIYFGEMEREGRKGEKHRCERFINLLPLACPQSGTWLQHRHVP